MIRKSKKPKSQLSKEIAKLDRIFSEFIRKRDCNGGHGKCISCGKIITYNDSDCGHYVNRKHMATRFDEQNCNAQCRSCNRFDEGNIQGYRKGLIKKYGEKAVEMLEIKKHNISKIGIFEIGILITEYKQKIKQL